VSPPPAEAGDNAAVAINLRDGSSTFRLAFKITRVNRDEVDSSNAAVAAASCTSCQTTAVAFQILIVTNDTHDFEPVNLAIALMSPDGLRPFIVNWEEVALYFVRGVQADALADNTTETALLLKRLLAFPGLPALSSVPPATDEDAPVVAIHFRRGETSLRMFTTIATLGIPQDITLSEIRIECFFPEDEPTASIFRDWASRPLAKPTAYSLAGN
jgi:hypothetical protein